MVGAIIANQSPVSLDDVTPIARLTGEYEAIVVPAASDIKTIDDLVAKLKADPGAVSWAGGSAGGVDHIVVGQIAEAAGVDPTKINYIPFSGGGEALAAILGGQVTAGVSGTGEWKARSMPASFGCSPSASGERIEGFDAPTLKESGLDVEVQNWRMVAARARHQRRAEGEPRRHDREDGQVRAWKDDPRAEGLGRTPSSPATISRPISKGEIADDHGRSSKQLGIAQ